MFRRVLEQRAVLAMLLATGVGVLGVHAYPVDRGNVYLQLIELRSPAVFNVLVYGYATLWFTTPFFALSMLASLVTIVAYRYPAGARARPLPPTCNRSDGRHRHSCSARRILRRNRARARANMAHDPAARALHGRHDRRGGRHGKDVGLHVSLHRTAPPLARERSRPKDRRPRPRSEGRLLPASARDARHAPGANPTTQRSASAATSATTRCTTISTRMPSPMQSHHW